MAVSALPLSMSVPLLHAAPLKAKTRPMESTARQNVVVGQDTPVRPEALVPLRGGSVAMDAGAEKPCPFQVSTAPLLSTSTQKLVLAHDTALSWPCGSAWLGCVHVRPLNTEGPPSAATQNVGDTHETWLAEPQAPRLPDHPDPLKANEFPSPSIVMQKFGAVQSMAVKPMAAGIVAGACQPEPLNMATWFRLGAAAQNVGVAQER